MSKQVEAEGTNMSDPDETRPAFYTPEISDMFDKAKDYINYKRDKDEEITRFSRDITWECKKVIFTLHRFFRSDKVLLEAQQRLENLVHNERYFLGLARAMEGEDLSYHHRRYTHCLQEFLEAFIFLCFLQHRKLPQYEEVRDKFIYTVPVNGTPNETTTEGKPSSEEPNKNVTKTLTVPLSITDYILGVGDFTGELMKATVPTLTRPQWHTFLFQSFAMVREIYTQLLGVTSNKKDFKRKMVELRRNVIKIETTVYKLKIKILVYGRLPDPKELKMIEESVTKGGNNEGNRREDDHEDSGVE